MDKQRFDQLHPRGFCLCSWCTAVARMKEAERKKEFAESLVWIARQLAKQA
jgi:hypothetical protein